MATRMVPLKELITMAQDELPPGFARSDPLPTVDAPQQFSLRLLNRQVEAEDVVSFQFTPDRPIDFRAGQFLHYTLPHAPADERGSERYFTIASAPSELSIMLSTRIPREASSFKHALADLQPGAVVQAGEPGGRFVYVEGEQQLVFIAGGIGITPFRSMLVELTATEPDVEITLLYGNRTPDIAFRPLFDALARVHPRFKVVYVVSEPGDDWDGPVGRIDAGFIARHVPELTTPLFYASGPQPMVRAIARSLSELGVRRDRIKRETFPGYDD